jgi:myo-inositol-1(or 4)-monophosphatase
LPDSEALTKDSELLFDAVREAGALAMTLLRQNVRRWSKSDGSQVTEADLKIDAMLAGRLQMARPSYGWLSEETPDSAERMTRGRLWVVDPIDGTSDFINGGEDWCIAAALVEDGRPVIASVYRPVREEFFWAIAGRGAHLDCLPIKVSDDASLDGARIMGNRKSLGILAPHGIDARVARALPLQLRLAFVAAGRLDGAVSIGPRNDWDLAAGDLLVHEAGGLVSGASGDGYVYNRAETWQQGLVAAGAKRHAAIINVLRAP